MVWCGVVWCGVVWCGVWCGVVWCGVVWCGVCLRACVPACVRACMRACLLTLDCPRMHVYDVCVYVCIDRKWVCMHVYMFVSI